MLKYGEITEVNEAKALARVTFQEDQVVSDWLPILVQKAAKDSYYYAPGVGEFVACLMDCGNENGVILGAVYTEETAPKISGKGITGVKFEDGTEIKYNSALKELTIKATGGVKITGDLDVTGTVSGLQVKAGLVDLGTHTHLSAAPGTPTGPPIPAP